MAEGKSSGTCEKLALSVLSLWFVASLITIVVWATAPDFKSAAQCRSELHDLTVQHEGSKVVCQKNQEALEQMVHQAQKEQDQLRAAILDLTDQLNVTNHTLEQSYAHNRLLLVNISSLQDNVDTLEQIQANLSTQLLLKEEHIEALELNLTQAEHQTQSCFSLKEAAEAQTRASESQTRACQSNENYLKKQLQKCKESSSGTAQQTSPQKTSADPTGSGPGLRPTRVLVLILALPMLASVTLI